MFSAWNSSIILDTRHKERDMVTIVLANKTVLLIEDRANFRQLIARILKRQEAIVIEASDGKEGLALLEKHKPDISICDIFMPVMTGHEFVVAAKANPITKDIPIIIITAIEQKEAAVKAVHRGADTYLLKPFSSTDLLQKIETVLQISPMIVV